MTTSTRAARWASRKFLLVTRLEDWWCHKLKLPGHDRLCDRYEYWLTGEDEDYVA